MATATENVHLNEFAGSVALVTGAGKGIGASVALALAKRGAAVALVDVDEPAVNERCSELARDGLTALSVVADLRRASDAERAVQQTILTYGGLDFLVNMAGVMRFGAAPAFSEDDWDFVFETNVKSQFLVAKYAIPHMRERGGGAIVNAASVMAFASQPQVLAYTASKAAIVGMTTAMALDHAAENIRVNCVAPGAVRTPMLRDGLGVLTQDVDAALDEAGRQQPIGRLVEPDEVAAVVMFLLSSEASAVTGSCYRVDGGLISRF